MTPSATLTDMSTWARGLMVRPPDFVIGEDYLRRWWVIPRNDFSNVYLHDFRVSDDDRALHDHPWASTSFVIEGGYIEHTPDGSFDRTAGDVVHRAADALHRIGLYKDAAGNDIPCISLFITGRKEREWGFACENGWVHWKDFTNPGDKGSAGKGCGEGSLK